MPTAKNLAPGSTTIDDGSAKAKKPLGSRVVEPNEPPGELNEAAMPWLRTAAPSEANSTVAEPAPADAGELCGCDHGAAAPAPPGSSSETNTAATMVSFICR